ncbi:MAG: hypothetical protein S0880_07480, partial [Actinomycetota bacterium]|nr:hypothetical protein [Actinomycetota bacterium]
MARAVALEETSWRRSRPARLIGVVLRARARPASAGLAPALATVAAIGVADWYSGPAVSALVLHTA